VTLVVSTPKKEEEKKKKTPPALLLFRKLFLCLTIQQIDGDKARNNVYLLFSSGSSTTPKVSVLQILTRQHFEADNTIPSLQSFTTQGFQSSPVSVCHPPIPH
jgi:hypothetical protein